MWLRYARFTQIDNCTRAQPSPNYDVHLDPILLLWVELLDGNGPGCHPDRSSHSTWQRIQCRVVDNCVRSNRDENCPKCIPLTRVPADTPCARRYEPPLLPFSHIQATDPFDIKKSQSSSADRNRSRSCSSVVIVICLAVAGLLSVATLSYLSATSLLALPSRQLL